MDKLSKFSSKLFGGGSDKKDDAGSEKDWKKMFDDNKDESGTVSQGFLVDTIQKLTGKDGMSAQMMVEAATKVIGGGGGDGGDGKGINWEMFLAIIKQVLGK